MNEEKIMSGQEVADALYERIRQNYEEARDSGALRRPPKLAIVLIGQDAGSQIYVGQKIRACEMLGFDYVLDQHQDVDDVDLSMVLRLVEKYNNDAGVDGMIVQMPLPEGVDRREVLAAIAPEKDVDGLTPASYGRLAQGLDFEGFRPCTGLGVVKMLEYYRVPIAGRRVAVVGAGLVAGRPIAMMLLNRGATVTVCNSKTPDLAAVTREADIVVAATGRGGLIGPEMLKDGAVVVDVGITRDATGKIRGDAEMEKVLEKVSLISPVPGGVGKMTVACLMANLLEAALAKKP